MCPPPVTIIKILFLREFHSEEQYMGKILGQTGFFSLGVATSLGEGKLRLRIDLVSYPTRTEGLVNMVKCQNSSILNNSV